VNKIISKSNENIDPLEARLDALPLAMYDRYIAQAHLARARAFAEAIAATGRFFKGLARSIAARPARRPTTLAG